MSPQLHQTSQPQELSGTGPKANVHDMQLQLQLAKNLAKEFSAKGINFYADKSGLIILLTDTEHFAFDKSKLNPAAEARMATIAGILKKYNVTQPVHIVGYTDSIGSEAYNLDLSRRRA